MNNAVLRLQKMKSSESVTPFNHTPSSGSGGSGSGSISSSSSSIGNSTFSIFCRH